MYNKNKIRMKLKLMRLLNQRLEIILLYLSDNDKNR